MAPPKNFEDFILPRSSFFIRIRDSRLLPPSSPPSPPLYFRNYTFPPVESNDDTIETVRPEDHDHLIDINNVYSETSHQFALTLSPTTMHSASGTSNRSTSRYSFAVDYDINITVTNDDNPFIEDNGLDAPFTSVQLQESNISESRETNSSRLLQHNNGNERALYTSLSAMHSEGNSRNSPRNNEYWTRAISNMSGSMRKNEPQYEQRVTEKQVSWLGQHPNALTSFQQHYEQDDKPDLSQESSNVMLPGSETSQSITSQSIYSKEFTPELFLFSIFDAIMKYLNAKYELRSSLRNSIYVVLLRVPILKRSFGGFKETCILAKELVAEMALEELIKQMPHVVYIVLKSKGLDDVLDVSELEELCANGNTMTMENENGLRGSQKQIRLLHKEHCHDDVEIEKLDCSIKSSEECPIKSSEECPIESSEEKSSTSQFSKSEYKI
ncbi:6573_t:CDS:2 [Cetraspora pellucida]|uniref:6573_t:CDS:1 n=1 Tax=Cetraspora pellucida TaxID=1433469 RepID=A0A9N9G666_9GLOM|nr:6573_t:CDS:2 [Cetraspora pellucida]